MRSSWVSRWTPRPRTSVFTTDKGRKGHRHTKMPGEAGVIWPQGTPGARRALQEEARKDCPLEPSRGGGSANILISDVWPPEPQESKLLLFQATRFLVNLPGSAR